MGPLLWNAPLACVSLLLLAPLVLGQEAASLLTRIKAVGKEGAARLARFATYTSNLTPPRLASKVITRPITAWSAGCATGQEPYSLAFLIDTYLTSKGRRAGFKLQATDISDINLKIAAAGVYAKAIVAAMPMKYHKYFEPHENQMRVVQPIRDLIQFQKADLCEKPLFSGLDLILCRNVMIYLTPESKSLILRRFHGAMNTSATLVLGAAEVILEPTLFRPLDTRHKIYEKV